MDNTVHMMVGGSLCCVDTVQGTDNDRLRSKRTANHRPASGRREPHLALEVSMERVAEELETVCESPALVPLGHRLGTT